MSNLALYRKYRSAEFAEVIGQEHVVGTLTNAISSGKHSHAYLLTGPRGVGKTTIARLIAKQLNGLGKDDVIADYLDIIEIDGASNRGIDEIRSLREKVQVLPARLEYKVYIIDEVHMLTTPAFNALLKTLEEPPAHVVFIFATTEAHKLPATIISRTQRFDFRSIPPAAMTKHLRYIAKQEKIDIDDNALELITTISRGGFRDAINLLDQISTLDGPITVDILANFTGLQDTSRIEQIFDASKSNDINKVVSLLQDLFNIGADASLLTQQMLNHIQALLLEGKKYDSAFLIQTAEKLHWAQANMRHSSLPQLVLQVGLARSSQPLLAPTSSKLAPELEQIKPPPSRVISPVGTHPASPILPTIAPTSVKQEEQLIKSLSVIKNHNNSLYAVLMGSEMSVNGTEIRVKCRFSFHKDRVSEVRNTSLVEKAFSKVYGHSMHLVTELVPTPNQTTENTTQDLVSSAMAILGGEVIDG